MNTYNENLQQTVVNTLSALSLQEANLDSEKTTAEYTLYYKQGAQITGSDKLAKTIGDAALWLNLNNQSIVNQNQVFNLLTAATDTNADVTTSMTNTATAASNVQIASNAISVLAADIGAALNIAAASLYETDLYNRITNANSFINEVANESRSIAKDAMNASSYISEITTTEVLAQTQALKPKIDNIFKSAQAELESFSKLAITETQQLAQFSQAERQAEGGLKDAIREVRAIETAYTNTNFQLNYNLSIDVVSGSAIQVTFTSLPTPLPPFKSSAASAISIPDAKPNYYLVLLPSKNQSMFSLDQAQQLFEQRAPDDVETFIPVQAQAGFAVNLSLDVNGDQIEAGSSYVAYLYIELSQAYKQFINNFTDMMSAPSQSFVPATSLLLPVGLSYAHSLGDDGLSWANIVFEVPSLYTQNPTTTARATDSNTAAEEESITAAAAYQDAMLEANVASQAAAVAEALAIAADAEAAQKAAAATQATAVAKKATEASTQATAAVSEATKAAAAANKANMSNPGQAKKAAVAANEKLAAAQAAETQAIAMATTATETATAASKAAEDAKTAKTAADAAKTTAETAKAAADKKLAEAAAKLTAAKAEKSRATAETTASSADSSKVAATKTTTEAASAKITTSKAEVSQATTKATDKPTDSKAEAAKTTTETAAKVTTGKSEVPLTATEITPKVAPAGKQEAATAADVVAVTMNPVFADAELEYRCILIQKELVPYPNFLRCADKNNHSPIYFNLNIAEQVSSANYITAVRGKTSPTLFEVKLCADVTDNFGNLVQPNVEYFPCILAVANGDNADKFVNVLATSFDPIVVCLQPKQPA